MIVTKRALNDDDMENAHKTIRNKENQVASTPHQKPTSPLRSLTCSVQALSTKTQQHPPKQQLDLFQRGKALFRRTVIPSRLLGRENERKVMTAFWTEHVLANKPGCLYVSGAPGTGKTAMLNDVKRQMEATSPSTAKKGSKKTTNHHHNINMTMINCMSVKEPKAIYTKIVTELKPTSRSSNFNFPEDADVIVQAEHLLLNTSKDTL